MLISFALTNYACFRDREELTLEPARRTDDDERSFATGSQRVPRLHRAAVVFGANASGKTRLVQGLAFVQQFVIGSSSKGQVGDPIPYEPFLFDAQTRSIPATFEVSFIQNGAVYEYSFSVDRERVHDERLLHWPRGGRQRMLLDREYDSAVDRESWSFGASVRGSKKAWQASTRPNALLVSTAAQLNSKVFIPVVEWFRNLRVVPAGALNAACTIRTVHEDPAARQRVLQMLRDADIPLVDVRTREEAVRIEDLGPPPEILKEMKEAGQTTIYLPEADLGHAVAGSSKPCFLDLDQESDGTQMLFSFAGPWLDVLDHDRVVVVDELDRSLHPHLTASLVRRINSASEGGKEKRSQLVATMHEATMLEEDLDRSQVWFVEKDRQTEAARLTPLSDYRPRKRENLMRGYLGGRYGGVPVLIESELRAD